VYPRAIQRGEAITAHVSRGSWYELSTLDRYLEASLLFMHKSKQTIIAGANSQIEDGATVEDAVLWDRVTVARGARVRHAVLGDDVKVPADAMIENAIVVRRDLVHEIERGEVAGENLIVPLG